MKCSKCGKNFDYEKYYGICPKCGTYNREDRQEENLFLRDGRDPFADMSGGRQEDSRRQEQSYNMLGQGQRPDPFREAAGEYTGEPRPSKVYQPKDEGDRPDTKKKKKGCLFFIICLLFCLLCIAAVIGAEMYYGMKREEMAALEELEIVSAGMGEEFTVDSHVLAVTGAQVLEEADMRPEFPQGEKCIAVSFTARTSDDFSDYLEVPYLAYETGGRRVYKEALYSDDFQVYAGYYGISLMDSYGWSYEENAEGAFVFFVEEDAQNLRVCVEERAGRYEEESLERVYEIPLSLTESGEYEDSLSLPEEEYENSFLLLEEGE